MTLATVVYIIEEQTKSNHKQGIYICESVSQSVSHVSQSVSNIESIDRSVPIKNNTSYQNETRRIQYIYHVPTDAAEHGA